MIFKSFVANLMEFIPMIGAICVSMFTSTHCMVLQLEAPSNTICQETMNPYGYPYGYHPAPPPVDPGGVTPITTNQQGVAMMAPHGYISAAPSPA